MDTHIETEKQENIMSRVQIISMLFDGALNFTAIARTKLKTGDSTGKSLYIRKTAAIIRELANSLNIEAGEIAQNLKKLYDYILDNLRIAEKEDNLKAINDAEKVIDILKSAWEKILEGTDDQFRRD